MWILLAIASALCLGFYDVFKKLSVDGNNVLTVLFLNTLFSSLLMAPVIVAGLADGYVGLGGSLAGHAHIAVKALIVLSSWLLGYFSIKHLPLTVAGPVNASRPVMVLVGAILIYGEVLNAWQWGGVALGFFSLFFISRIGMKEGAGVKEGRWVWMAIGAAFMGAVSALYDKWLLGRYEPLEVQAWYSFYQMIIMGVTVALMLRWQRMRGDSLTPFRWRWSIVFISLFLTAADIAYFYALSLPGAMIAIVSMIRRGSVIVSFFYGVLALRERHVRAKLVDLCVLLAGLVLLVIGSM
ncbi:DMT family transporter [uncultured Muribaculum sp.]|uniref:DMT family transporter n=1 Tax=uncultured Muribaculum sp. TaxID=1918613 RepID=UPI0025D623FC|nr:DMT family transporter [uncultured Muribaculum sp.]